jgi:hypothetical protein
MQPIGARYEDGGIAKAVGDQMSRIPSAITPP